ncbi:hypothetical protein ACH5RR_019889 [Cinchona calisaya]|uniref:5'-3' exoribonuclease 2 n=1 Tax=Cinchona calisaya TaxID=153742 RepID=A0ABD2ZTR5_9GENT
MGIPAFYRWLAERYPRSVVEVVEDAPVLAPVNSVPIDTSKPNPNGFEFDNLYLDMNGIIHPCFHPEELPAPDTYEDVFKAVFKYIDRIFSMIRPRKLIYMAIDGVAPRAKMNQQRSRRFRAAKEAADEAPKTETLKEVYVPEGEKLGTKKLDSNIITPGSQFMELLSSALRYYVHLKMNSDPGWRGVKVILSDASVPGEGEHKIMSYIRLQRNLPGFDPNTRHCLYGLDADLIMLGLATHEIHFSILREDVRKALPKDKNPRRGMVKPIKGKQYLRDFEVFISRQRFQFCHIWVLRDYLAHELRIPDPTVKVDLDRLMDDFVFMCLFVGNDFLPHVPSLEISEGAIDLLMTVYKKEFTQMGGYLTNSCEVDLERVEHFVQALGAYENAIFRKRAQAQKEWERNLRQCAVKPFKYNQTTRNHFNAEARFAVDKVKLGEEGWKERYYNAKFEVQDDEVYEKIRRDAVFKYVEGICWVMHYYYQGVCSWQWFYPYHYAPFASDFHGLHQLEINFNLGKPFKPFDQLMAVLPAASAQALPLFYRKLMTDPASPILDFYPSDFELDMNGKRHAWQAVCKLPFINELRLLSEIEKVEHTLTDEEKRRNSLGVEVLFVHISHPLAAKIFSFCKHNKSNPKLPQAKVKRKIEPEFSDGMNGYMYISDRPVCPVDIYSPIDDMELITNNEVVSIFYKPPLFHPHIAKISKGVIVHGKSVSKHDIQPPPILWHEKTFVGRNRIFQRRIPRKAVSGHCLTKLAHQLVSQNPATKLQDNVDGYHNEVLTKQQDNVDGDHNKVGKRKRNRKTRNRRKSQNSVTKLQDNVDGDRNEVVTKLQDNVDGDHNEVVTKLQDNVDGDHNKVVTKLQDNVDGDPNKVGKRKRKRKMKNRRKSQNSGTKLQDNVDGDDNEVVTKLQDDVDGDHNKVVTKLQDNVDGDHNKVGKRKRNRKKRRKSQNSVTKLQDNVNGDHNGAVTKLQDNVDGDHNEVVTKLQDNVDGDHNEVVTKLQDNVDGDHNEVVTKLQDNVDGDPNKVGKRKRKRKMKNRRKSQNSGTKLQDNVDGDDNEVVTKLQDDVDGEHNKVVTKLQDNVDGDPNKVGKRKRKRKMKNGRKSQNSGTKLQDNVDGDDNEVVTKLQDDVDGEHNKVVTKLQDNVDGDHNKVGKRKRNRKMKKRRKSQNSVTKLQDNVNGDHNEAVTKLQDNVDGDHNEVVTKLQDNVDGDHNKVVTKVQDNVDGDHNRRKSQNSVTKLQDNVGGDHNEVVTKLQDNVDGDHNKVVTKLQDNVDGDQMETIIKV